MPGAYSNKFVPPPTSHHTDEDDTDNDTNSPTGDALPLPPIPMPPMPDWLKVAGAIWRLYSKAMSDAGGRGNKDSDDNDNEDNKDDKDKKNDTEYCYEREADETKRCWDRKEDYVYPDFLYNGCLVRAKDRRNLCVKNGGKPNPDEPPEWGLADRKC